MLNKIILWAIKHPISTIVVTLGIAAIGGWSLSTMKVDVIPDVNKPTVAVFAEGEGLAPEEIEKRILIPIESAPACDRHLWWIGDVYHYLAVLNASTILSVQ